MPGLILLIISGLLSFSACASVVIMGTRVVYPEQKKVLMCSSRMVIIHRHWFRHGSIQGMRLVLRDLSGFLLSSPLRSPE